MTARIKPAPNPNPKAQEQLAAVKKMLGSTPNMFTTLANSSAALNFYLSGASALNHAKIPADLREQIALAVAGTNTCDYCASAHTALGKKENLKESELSQNLMGKSGNSKTQAALKFAQQIVKLRGQVSDADLKAVRDAGYSEEEIVEIVAATCLNIFTNYFNHIAGTEVDFPKVSTAMAQSAR